MFGLSGGLFKKLFNPKAPFQAMQHMGSAMNPAHMFQHPPNPMGMMRGMNNTMHGAANAMNPMRLFNHPAQNMHQPMNQNVPMPTQSPTEAPNPIAPRNAQMWMQRGGFAGGRNRMMGE